MNCVKNDIYIYNFITKNVELGKKINLSKYNLDVVLEYLENLDGSKNNIDSKYVNNIAYFCEGIKHLARGNIDIKERISKIKKGFFTDTPLYNKKRTRDQDGGQLFNDMLQKHLEIYKKLYEYYSECKIKSDDYLPDVLIPTEMIEESSIVNVLYWRYVYLFKYNPIVFHIKLTTSVNILENKVDDFNKYMYISDMISDFATEINFDDPPDFEEHNMVMNEILYNFEGTTWTFTYYLYRILLELKHEYLSDGDPKAVFSSSNINFMDLMSIIDFVYDPYVEAHLKNPKKTIALNDFVYLGLYKVEGLAECLYTIFFSRMFGTDDHYDPVLLYAKFYETSTDTQKRELLKYFNNVLFTDTEKAWEYIYERKSLYDLPDIDSETKPKAVDNANPSSPLQFDEYEDDFNTDDDGGHNNGGSSSFKFTSSSISKYHERYCPGYARHLEKMYKNLTLKD